MPCAVGSCCVGPDRPLDGGRRSPRPLLISAEASRNILRVGEVSKVSRRASGCLCHATHCGPLELLAARYIAA